MSKNTSIALSEHFQALIKEQVQSGQYASASEVVRAAMHLFEERVNRLEHLRVELRKGEEGEGISIDEYKKSFAEKRRQHLADKGITE